MHFGCPVFSSFSAFGAPASLSFGSGSFIFCNRLICQTSIISSFVLSSIITLSPSILYALCSPCSYSTLNYFRRRNAVLAHIWGVPVEALLQQTFALSEASLSTKQKGYPKYSITLPAILIANYLVVKVMLLYIAVQGNDTTITS